MKSLMSLWSQLAIESASICRTSATADINTASRRIEDEGLSFLTITLPDLGKSIQKWIDQGEVGCITSFKTGRGRLPLFLGGFSSRVFDRHTGVLLDDPCVDSIIALRQLTLMYSKIELPCSSPRVRKAMRGYVECEQDVRQMDKDFTDSDIRDFQRMSTLLFSEVFTQMDRDIHYGQLLPKHGPGVVADKLTSNGKYQLRTWTRRLEEVFPSYEYLIPNLHFHEELDKVDILEPDTEMPVQVITVPKTMKTPRIIAVEPACMQYMQQAVRLCFMSAFERDELLQKLIGFDDQAPNQELAHSGSVDGRTATLDLSDASDRVSNQLVRAMVSKWPHLMAALDATRSRRADVPGHGIIRVAKFASMGSALCFPIEAMVFTTMIFLGIERSLNTTLTRKDINAFSDVVRVFGDDLIVPVDHVLSVVQTLEHFGARVGLDKSFWTGKFRESCGKEYFNGTDVSLVRVRQVLPSTTADATEVIATVALRNQLYELGYWRTTSWLDNLLRGMLKHFPRVGPASSVLGRVSFLGYDSQRMHPYLHSPLVRGYVVQAKAPSDVLGGMGALLKCLLKLEHDKPQGVLDRHIELVPCYRPGTLRENGASLWAPPMGQDEKHLERSGRPKRVGIRLGWWPAY